MRGGGRVGLFSRLRLYDEVIKWEDEGLCEGGGSANPLIECNECCLSVEIDVETLELRKPERSKVDYSASDLVLEALNPEKSGQKTICIESKGSSPTGFIPADAEDTIDSALMAEPGARQHTTKVVQVVEQMISQKIIIGGRFKLERELGRGATAIVAEALEGDRSVAVKIHIETAAEGEDGDIARRRVKRVFELQAMFKSQAVPRQIMLIKDHGPWMNVEQFIRGTSLGDALRKGETIQQQFALMIGIQILNVIEEGWELARIVHRDLKPDNIMLSSGGASISSGLTAVVIDWGLSKSLKEKTRDTPIFLNEDLEEFSRVSNADISQSLTAAGVVQGTLNYMPIEQLMGEDVDIRADMYSLGATLFHAVTGQPPLLASSLQELIGKIRMSTPPSAKEVAESRDLLVSDQLAAVLAKSMEKDPLKRYQTAEEFKTDLLACRDGKPISAPPIRSENKSRTGRFLRWLGIS